MNNNELVKDYLSKLRKSGYNRDNFDSFLRNINFKYSIPSFHIAGTNGKGSTSNFINNYFVCLNKKVGYFHSPYLYSPNETILINNNPISENEFLAIIEQFDAKIKQFDLSEYEVLTLVALTYFQNQNCDIAIIECCMGGEFDATNIFNPILSIITSISLEHTSFLGTSLSQIAFHKAGIIKENVPVVISNQITDDALSVVANKVKECSSKIISTVHITVDELTYDGSILSFDPYFFNLKTKINSQFLIEDLEIALTSILSVSNLYPFSKESFINSILMDNLPARFEIVSKNPFVVIDGAHNPESVKALVDTCEKVFNLPIHIIYASFKDKNINATLPILNLLTNDISLTTFNHPRARKEEEYFLYLGDYNFYEDYISLIKSKIKEFPNDIILITGSLAFAGDVRKDFFEGKIK